MGIPIPPDAAHSPTDIGIETSNGSVIRTQVRALDFWPDRSIRWALVDFSADVGGVKTSGYVLRLGQGGNGAPAPGLSLSELPRGVEINTGGATFRFSPGGSFPVSAVTVGDRHPVDAEQSGLLIDLDGQVLDFRVSEVHVRDSGPLRAELEVRGIPTSGHSALPLDVWARVELFAHTATARIEITLRNRRRARHRSGQWVLGDRGSIYLRSATLVLKTGTGVRCARCAPEPGSSLSEVQLPFEIYQESSGGEHWNTAVHLNRDGRVPLRFRGYRALSGGVETRGFRASPVVVVDLEGGQLAVAVPKFWENFPRALSVQDGLIEVGLLPRQSEDVHELQGGEQKAHVLVIAFDGDDVSDPPLAWVHDPQLLYPSAEWCCATGAVPFLAPSSERPDAGYLALVNAALDPKDGFLAKRERMDEYGWRHFGELPADHESAFQPPDTPFVSHYNNQYDALAGFATHFLRTGDPRWWQLMVDLARHTRDIDVYHTREDKAAYNGGLFWHTQHYTDAGTSTHRTYPRGTAGGGPSAEHNYNAGLMLHYFLTGERASRDPAIGLGQWVIDMDDGRLTTFRWLAAGPTGYASAAGSMAYHGPGRGGANSIVACLAAWRLSNDEKYVRKAEELIRRCIHPQDDIEALDLLDVERRWYYTVFLQALGTYLQYKAERGEFDAMYGHARESLVRYARWMAAHERPYLERPKVLEFPTETWAAQDMRKAEVFLSAALHASGEARQLFLERARFFFEYSVAALSAMATRHLTRPVVLMLSNGFRWNWFQINQHVLPEPIDATSLPGSVGRPRFLPQRTIALRRAKWLVVLVVVATATLLTLLLD